MTQLGVTQMGAREGHAMWAAVYNDSANPLLALEQRTAAPWLPRLKGRTFLDAACGTGRWAEWAVERGARVIGVDFSQPMLSQAAARSGLDLLEADVRRLPLRSAIADCTMCAFAAGYVDSPGDLMAELSRVTSRGGSVVLTDVHPAAIEAGWRRSFRRENQVYEIVNRANPISDYFESARKSSLLLERFAEVSIDEPERPLFQCCGREDRFADACSIRAIFVALWRKA